MAVPSTSPLAGNEAASPSKEMEEEEGSTEAGEHQAKRTKNPGVRVIGGKIYCSVNGKTCHQCRQKTLVFAASCKTMKGPKQCTIKFCQKCLWNRYGEKAADVAKLEDWSCPKCRGICNCSFCMKKRGHQPTGIMVHTAKKTGYSSVSEMLRLGGACKLDSDKIAKDTDQSPIKPLASDMKPIAIAPTKLGKENSLVRKVVLGLSQQVASKSPMVKTLDKSSKRRSAGLKEVDNGDTVEKSPLKDKPLKSLENLEQKPDIEMKEQEKDKRRHKERTKRKLDVSCGFAKEEEHDSVRASGSCGKAGTLEVPLPQGICLTAVGGVELPVQAVGEALQFLEFCSTFGKVLDLRKGQAESILRELICSRKRRHGQPPSFIVRFHIQLLSFVLEDIGEESPSLSATEDKDSWLKALAKFTSESELASREFPSDCFADGYESYDNLDISKKLRLLNFLCDEVLGTEHFRNWIEDQNSKLAENDKEAKEKIVAAKNKEKLLRQKMQSEVAEAIIAKNGVPLSISEHDAIVSQVKQEIAESHAELLQIMGTVSKKRLRSDAVRTEPVLLDTNGRAFWKLKTYSGESDILLQDFGTCDSTSEEKWFSYDAEKKQELDAYISSLRSRKPRIRMDYLSSSNLQQQDNVVA